MNPILEMLALSSPLIALAIAVLAGVAWVKRRESHAASTVSSDSTVSSALAASRDSTAQPEPQEHSKAPGDYMRGPEMPMQFAMQTFRHDAVCFIRESEFDEVHIVDADGRDRVVRLSEHGSERYSDLKHSKGKEKPE